MFKKNPLRAITFFLAALFGLQFYFIRELLLAELIFSLGFAILLMIGAFFYLVGSISESAPDLVAAGARRIVKLSSDICNLMEAGIRHSVFKRGTGLNVLRTATRRTSGPRRAGLRGHLLN